MNPKIVKIEKILGTAPDGVWGDDDKMALNKLTKTKPPQQAPPQNVKQDVQDVPPNPDEVNPTTYT